MRRKYCCENVALPLAVSSSTSTLLNTSRDCSFCWASWTPNNIWMTKLIICVYAYHYRMTINIGKINIWLFAKIRHSVKIQFGKCSLSINYLYCTQSCNSKSVQGKHVNLAEPSIFNLVQQYPPPELWFASKFCEISSITS